VSIRREYSFFSLSLSRFFIIDYKPPHRPGRGHTSTTGEGEMKKQRGSYFALVLKYLSVVLMKFRVIFLVKEKMGILVGRSEP